MKLVFMGTPEFSVPILESLIEHYEVVGVVTQPDKEVGRKHVLTPSPVKETALKHRIPVFQPMKMKEDYQTIVDWQPDLIVTCAYGQMIPDAILQLPPLGCINVHASLLPKLRGGAPIQKAIIDGYEETGITIMEMVSKMDAGAIIRQSKTKILEEDTYETLHDRLSFMGRDLLLETLPSIITKSYTKIEQDESEVTFAYNIKREEEHLDVSKTRQEVYNQIRGLYPVPGCYVFLDDKMMKIYKAKISQETHDGNLGEIVAVSKEDFSVRVQDGEICVTEIQLEGKKRTLVKDYFHGVDPKSLLGKVLK